MSTKQDAGDAGTALATVDDDSVEPTDTITEEGARKLFETLKALRVSMNRTAYEIGARANEFYRAGAWTLLGYEEGEHGFNKALQDAFGTQHRFARLVMKRVEQLPLLPTSALAKLSTHALDELMRLGDGALDPYWAQLAETASEEEFLAEVQKRLKDEDENGGGQHNETLRTVKVGSIPDSLKKVWDDTFEGFRRICREIGMGESNEATLEYLIRAALESPHTNVDGEIEDAMMTNETFLETIDQAQAKALQKFTARKQKRSPKPKHSQTRAKEHAAAKKKGPKAKAKKKKAKKRAKKGADSSE